MAFQLSFFATIVCHNRYVCDLLSSSSSSFLLSLSLLKTLTSFYSLLYVLIILSSVMIIPAKCDNTVNDKVFTNEFAVCLQPDKCDDSTAESLANRHGFHSVGKIGSMDCHYLLKHNHISKRSTDYSHSHHSRLSQDNDVLWVEQQHVKSRVKRDNPNTNYRFSTKSPMPDPLYKDMWYLNKGALGGYDMNVKGAWNMGYTGRGIVVTILDDGIQPNHPDLVSNYDPQASYDINDNDPDPTPQDNGDNKHGTRCAGEVAAQAYNEYCGVGIAFNASIGGVRMLDGTVTDEVEARALSLNPNHIDIYSASWGPEDDGKTVDGPGRLAQRAFIDGIRKGRHGRGSVFIWASGNGGRRLDSCNCDGYTNSIYTLSISSATQNGEKPWYLEECSSTLATTYSSGTPGRDDNVLSVDQDTTYFKSLESGGTVDTSRLCTRSHTGTSASAPIAAAIVALALEANPTLTWRDLQHLVMLSSRYEPLRHESGWLTNGVGRRVSHKFGYGLIDATQMVRFAETWTPIPAQRICESHTEDREQEIPAHPKRHLEVTLNTDACKDSSSEIKYLEHIQAKITLKYKPRGSLKISLVSPSGTITHLLFARPRDTDESTFTNWPFLSVHFWGEPAYGKWKLIIQNDSRNPARLPGKLISWSLTFHGTYERPASFHFTPNQTIHYLPRSAAIDKMSECFKQNMFQALDSTDCLKQCPPGQWPNHQLAICEKCSSECQTCFGPAGDNCLSCPQNKTFFGYHCVKQCPDKYYNDVKLNECLPCLSNCETCDLSPNHCTSCKKSLLLNDDHRCVLKCDSSNDSKCLKCHNTCASCYGTADNQCLSCSTGKRLLNGVCTDQKCPQMFYEESNSDGLQCQRCHNTCNDCTGSAHNDCISCFANETLTEYGLCLSCLSGQFLNIKTSKCESCHVSCSACTGPTATDCVDCRTPYALDNSRCVPCCPVTVNDINGIAEDMDNCCHCLSDTGICSIVAIDRTRSVSQESDSWLGKQMNGNNSHRLFENPITVVVVICLSALFVFVIVFSILQYTTRSQRRDIKMNEYQKVSTSFEKMSEVIGDDYEEEESLFEKT
ncbi:endoprotease bli-like [Oppia nitens]|uniref:endoprotease bli-like n=1 Tax=Oppia nitens TaxID=1686743 RepID=UPI0023DB8C95|nr:endoprotease bli-like [Oppia nitens]